MSPLFIMIESVGILAFSLSGALSAARKDMDIFGFAVLALMPAVGGGTLRDLVLDVPVFWWKIRGQSGSPVLAFLLSISGKIS